ncbi:unnamed protein product [Lepidochelys kempii]
MRTDPASSFPPCPSYFSIFFRVLATSSVEDNPSRQLGRLNKCTLTSNGLHCEEVGLRGNIQKSKNIQDGGIVIARSAEWILACLQKKWHRALSITEELNGICTQLTADFQEKAFLNLGNIIETKFNNRDQNNNNNKINVTDTDNFIGADSALGISTAVDSTSNNSRSSHACEADSGTEIAIVLDGSGSIEPEDFERAKGFISNMMTSFWRKCPEGTFAVVQYGAEIQTEFDLQESSNKSTALCKVHNIMRLGSVTKTASALQHVLDAIFNESRSSVKDAHRMILVMTDGEIFLDSLSLTDVMSSPKMATIERYALGVGPSGWLLLHRSGDVFSKQRALKELQLIASDPDEDYLFKLPVKPWMASCQCWTEIFWVPQQAGSGYENQNSNNNKISSDMEEDDDDSSDSGTEIAIVLDGSGSIEPEDFERAKAFIYNIMKTFYEKCFEAHFSVIWQLDEALFPDKTANITINVTKPTLLLIEEHILDIRYAFSAVLTKPTPVVYVNVSQGHSENKEFLSYQWGKPLWSSNYVTDFGSYQHTKESYYKHKKYNKNTGIFFFKLFQRAIPVPQTFRRAGLDPY